MQTLRTNVKEMFLIHITADMASALCARSAVFYGCCASKAGLIHSRMFFKGQQSETASDVNNNVYNIYYVIEHVA